MDKATFKTVYTAINGIESERDEYGNTIENSKRARRWAYIDSLDLEPWQKDALNRCFYAASTLKDAPWNK